MKKLKYLIWTVMIVLSLTACTTDQGRIVDNDEGDAYMNVSNTHRAPDYVKVADKPTYPVGSQVIINADHVPGMKGAKATIKGAYQTTVYMVSYIPKTVGDSVNNYKWVIHEEIANAKLAPYKPGEKVVLNVDHIKGMDGAGATIESAKQTTVYMVNYMDTRTGTEVENYQWVIEDELLPAKQQRKETL